jgi:L-amino acid N-acyltransferase YncA
MLRLIQLSDAAAVLEIYAHYVKNTYVTFDYEVPALEEFKHKIETITEKYPWLVYEENTKILGYAYGSTHRAKIAYQWSPEATIYLNKDYSGRGIGRLLYSTLFTLLRSQGFYNVFAGISMPNPQSELFHKSLGFTELGIFKNIGYKSGAWHDTLWLQLELKKPAFNPSPPLTPLQVSEQWKTILKSYK